MCIGERGVTRSLRIYIGVMHHVRVHHLCLPAVPCIDACAVTSAVMSVHEDMEHLPQQDALPITHALKGDLDPNDRWKELLMAVEDSHDDGPPLDPDFRDHLELCHRRKESCTVRLLRELGHKGYRVGHRPENRACVCY